MNRRRIRLPMLLTFVGVLALVGCIPIPATQQFMPNGNLKPSWKIGKGNSNPVWLGHTTLDQAIAFLNSHVAGSQGQYIFGRRSIDPDDADIRDSWLKLDGHHFAMPYRVRTWLVVWPLCAMTTDETKTQFLVLTTDDAQHVIDYQVLGADEIGRRYSKAARMFPERPHPFRWQTTQPSTQTHE